MDLPASAKHPSRPGGDNERDRRLLKGLHLSQERIVFAIAVLLFVGFSISTRGFLTAGNILSLIQNVSILGVLGIGMAQAIIGRGIDLSIVATMAMTRRLEPRSHAARRRRSAWRCWPGLAMAIVIGLINGFLIAYVEIPSIFATLAMATVIYGFGQNFLVPTDITYLSPSAGWLKSARRRELSRACRARSSCSRRSASSPSCFCASPNGAASSTRWATIRWPRGVAGIPTRPMMLLQYVLAALIAFLAGLVTASVVNSMSTRVVNSTLVYDVILVAVIGGIGLSGGKGGVRNVDRRHAC